MRRNNTLVLNPYVSVFALAYPTSSPEILNTSHHSLIIGWLSLLITWELLEVLRKVSFVLITSKLAPMSILITKVKGSMARLLISHFEVVLVSKIINSRKISEVMEELISTSILSILNSGPNLETQFTLELNWGMVLEISPTT